MRLEPANGISIDLDERFRAELKGLPATIALEGNDMLVAIARILLARHAGDIAISRDGERVRVCSIEGYGACVLLHLLEGGPLPGRCLLHTLPERLLIDFARREGIPVQEEPKDPARVMLDSIAAVQPQTYYSLARSADRLIPFLRERLTENDAQGS